jgi:endonuclease/exonuclease/phosphatase family metal-dependent hydrolase
MRILTWNIGIFCWYKYAHYLNLKINGEKIKHEGFQKPNLDKILRRIKSINPDVCLLEEIETEEDRQLIISNLKLKFPHYQILDSWYGKKKLIFFSKTTIETKRFGESNFYLLRTNNLNFAPIHFYSFLDPKRRLLEIKTLFKNFEKEKMDCIFGDTNFWVFGKKYFFLFSKDKLGYKLLTEKFNDATKNVGFTCRTLANLDKIFLSKEIKYKNPTCLREKNGKLMDHFPVFVDIE